MNGFGACQALHAMAKAEKMGYYFDFLDFLKERQDWSLKTFGEGNVTEGTIAHLRKELIEVEQEPDSLEEWIDCLLLSLDGAMRAGYLSKDEPFSPLEIIAALNAKFEKLKLREWKKAPEGHFEHIKD